MTPVTSRGPGDDRRVHMLLARLFVITFIFAALPAIAGESDLGKRPEVGYSESLCIAGVAADDSRRIRDVAGELRSCNERVRGVKRRMNRIGFAIQLCETSFRNKPLQRRACYLQTMSINAPSESMANIGMECVKYNDDSKYSTCVLRQLAALDQLLRAGANVANRSPRPHSRSAAIGEQD